MPSQATSATNHKRRTPAYELENSNQSTLTTLFAGFSGLSYQIISFKLIATAGLSDGLSIAISLTAFVAIAGIGAFFAGRLPMTILRFFEYALGLYALALFGIALLAGLDSYIDTLGGLSVTQKQLALIVLVSPLSFLSGALIPVYERSKTYHSSNSKGSEIAFAAVYGLFHLGGAAALILMEQYLFPNVGWPMAGAIFATGSIINASFAKHPAQAPPTAGTKSDGYRRAGTYLLLISIGTGYMGLASYKAFDYLVGPNIRNYTVVTSLIFVGLGISGLIARARKFTLQDMISLTAAGILTMCLMCLALPWLTSEGINVGLPAWGLYSVACALLIIPSYALIGLSIPTAVQSGLGGGAALLLSATGNAIGYWTYVGMAPMNIDFAILIAIGLILCLGKGWKVFASTSAVALALITLFPDVKPALQHTILAQNVHSLGMFEDSLRGVDQSRSLSFEGSWNTWGWPVDVMTVNRRSAASSSREKRFIINGFLSLTLSDSKGVKYGESAAALIPAMFAESHKRALVIGSGTAVSAGSLTDYFDNVDLVDISADTTSIIKHFSKLNSNALERLNVHQTDAISFITEQSSYDYIFNTVTGAGYAFSAMLYTQEFFKRAKENLSENGVFALWVDSRSPVKTTASELMSALKSTFKHVEYLTVFPNQRMYGDSMPYSVIFASDSPLRAIRASIAKEVDHLLPGDDKEPSNGDLLKKIIQDRTSTIPFSSDAEPSSMSHLSFSYSYQLEIQRKQAMLNQLKMQQTSVLQ